MPDLTFHITTFGCQMNAHDSDWLARGLARQGFRPAEPGEKNFHGSGEAFGEKG